MTLTPTASAGSRFAGWSGACSGTGACMVTMDAAKSVNATFTVQYKLTVQKKGLGTGSVTSSPAGINCGATCSFTYDGGTMVTLTASADATSAFAGWQGGGCVFASTDPCTVTLSAATTVKANFNDLPPTVRILSLTVNKAKKTATAKFAGTDPGNAPSTLTYQCKLDDNPFVDCKSPITYKRLKKGHHLFKVVAFDSVGQISNLAQRNFSS